MSAQVQGVWVEAAVTAGAVVNVEAVTDGAVQEVTAADIEATPGAAHLNRF